MSVCIIELNDSEIRAARDARIILRSPGYAVVKKDQLFTGNDALRLAYLNPRETYNRYWDKLNQDALQTPVANYRHHADLAYAHLMAIYEQCGKPEEVLFAVPCGYTREKLALLLGIASACPFQAVGMVDSAVAAAAAVAGRGNYQFLEIYLHHAVITRLDADAHISRSGVEVLDDTGLLRIQAAIAALIADLFIEQSRFDPLHHAATEQALYDQLPQCLQSLRSRSEVLFEIHYKNTTHQARLHREALLARLQPVYARILQRLAPDRTLLLGDRVNALPGLAELLPQPSVLAPESVFRGCAEHHALIRSQGPALTFITSLPVAERPDVATAPRAATQAHTVAEQAPVQAVTHVLCGHQAWPLSPGGCYLSGAGTVSATRPADCRCQISVDGNGMATVSNTDNGTVYLNGSPMRGPAVVRPGDRLGLTAADNTCTFISVNTHMV